MLQTTAVPMLGSNDVQIFTDAQLLALIARGENWALSEIYDRYAGLVFSIALRILSDSACADEIVQGVFYESLAACPGLSSGTRQVFIVADQHKPPPVH
jgi:hypothetical protein